MTVRLTSDEAEERVKRVRSARGNDRSNFCALVKRAGLDPARDLRYGTFSGVDFAGCNLDGYDFTGANLRACKFIDARIAGATFSQCEFALPNDGTNGFDPSGAEDWREAYRRSNDTDLKVPHNFDLHIVADTYFRDFAFAPLMRCVVLIRPSREVVKFAIAVSNKEVSQCRRTWEAYDHNRPNRMRDFVDSLSRDLGFGNYYKYDTVDKPYRATSGLQRGSATQVQDAVAENWDRSFNAQVSHLLQSGLLRGGSLVRRMRTTGCEFPCDYYERP